MEIAQSILVFILFFCIISMFGVAFLEDVKELRGDYDNE